jgi:ribosomal protein S21
MVVVNKKKGESIDKLMRRFTKVSRDENIVWDVNKKLFYKSPAQMRKEKQKERLKRKAQQRKMM